MKTLDQFVTEAKVLKVPTLPRIQVYDLDSYIGDKKMIAKVQKGIDALTKYQSAGGKLYKGSPTDGEIKKWKRVLKYLTDGQEDKDMKDIKDGRK